MESPHDPPGNAAEEAQFQFVHGQTRATFPALLAAYEAESRAAVDGEKCELELPYGPAARQTFDFFAARGKARGTLAYFHAGYWQSRDKSTFRFIAPAFTAAGLNVALVNYPLCPAVSLPELIEATKASVGVVRDHADAGGGVAASRLVLSGHSAGGHLAIELALSASAGALPPVAGVAALSGIFDLAPLVATSLNDKLRLSAASALACSPLHRVTAGAVPAVMAVGGAETPAFVDQTRSLHEAWVAAGNTSTLHIETGADHFSLLRRFSSAGELLFQQVCGLLPEMPAVAGT